MKKILAMILVTVTTGSIMTSVANAFPIKPIELDNMQLSVIKLVDLQL